MVKIFFSSFKVGMKKFADLLADGVNLVLLSFVYVVGVGLVSAAAKIMRKKFVDEQSSQSEKTFWVVIEEEVRPEDLYRMF